MFLFHTLARAINPDLVAWQQANAVSVTAEDCHLHVFVGPWSRYSACDRAEGHLASRGVAFTVHPGAAGQDVIVAVNDVRIVGYQPAMIDAELVRAGFRMTADPAKVDRPLAFAVLLALMVLATMVYGPMAALLVGMFPAEIRYTAISLPYHIGNGWFGGVLPLMAAALVTWSGNIYAGLYYPVAVAGLSALVGACFLRSRRRPQSAPPG